MQFLRLPHYARNDMFMEDNSQGSNFIEYMNYLDKLILRAMFVPERAITQDGATGSYSMAQAHRDAFLLNLDGIIADIEECINNQVIEPLLAYNFGVGRQKPRVRLNMERLSRNRRDMVATLVEGMLSSGKLQLDAQQVAEMLDLPVEAEDDNAERVHTA